MTRHAGDLRKASLQTNKFIGTDIYRKLGLEGDLKICILETEG